MTERQSAGQRPDGAAGQHGALPTFFVLGAAKSGTSSLYHYLGQHPDVVLSIPKEPRFFEAEYHLGPDYYATRYLGHWDGEPARGDASPRNLYVPYVAERIAETVPSAQLVVVLRNPVDRAYSAWWMNVSYGQEALAFADAVQDNLQRVAEGDPFGAPDSIARWMRFLAEYDEGRLMYRTYVDMGYYADQIERYLMLYPKDRLKVILSEDLKEDPISIARDVWRFIGVTGDRRVEDATLRKVALGPVGSRVRRWVHRARMTRVLPERLRAQARDVFTKAGDTPPPMLAEDRESLTAHYRPHNERLSALIGRDLSDWM